jgi:hypothetical protein
LINLSYQFLSENSRIFSEEKQMSNVEIVTNIDIASEIAHATVTEVLANMENERIGYVLIGVLQQLETIQDNVNGTWVLYSPYSSMGYEEIKQEILDSGKVIYHRRITQLGREFILQLFNNVA